MTYPSGLRLFYERDPSGRVTRLRTDRALVADSASSLPFGPYEAWTCGQRGFEIRKTFNQRSLIQSIQAGDDTRYEVTHGPTGQVNSTSGFARPLLGSSETSYSYDGNRLITENGDQTRVTSYDQSGRIVTKGSLDFQYNQAGRLERVMKHGRLRAKYGYDGLGRRVKKQVSRLTRYFHYDLQGRLISISNARGRPVRDFIYMDEELVAMKVYRKHRGLYFFVTDHLGTPRKIVNREGRVVWHAAYEPFGQAHILKQRVVCNLRFPGQYFDHETGLHSNWHRYYDPSTGRYLTPDPIGLAGGLHPYAYAGNNPVNWIDPDGRFVIFGPILGGISGAIGGFTSGLISSDRSLIAATAGGIVGGIAGASVGLINPFAGSVAGEMTGAIVGGSVGGAIGGATSSTLNNNFKWKSVQSGALYGGISGLIASPGVGLTTYATSGSALGNSLMAISGATLGDTIISTANAINKKQCQYDK